MPSKYQRESKNIPIKSIQDKKLKAHLRKSEKKSQDAMIKASQSEMLLTEDAGYLSAEGMEKTFKFTQNELKKQVDLNTSQKMFELKLTELGPYAMNYTRNGRHLLLGGKKGHLASFDWQTGKLHSEHQVYETIRDVQWLHNEKMYAVAQKKYTFIYDNTGSEIRCLKEHIEVNRLEFLPFHFLLASVGNAGYLKYNDTSTGQCVAEHRTKLGPCQTMTQNPWNAIIHLGHHNGFSLQLLFLGTVTLWSPSMSEPLVKMLCHKGPVQSIACDLSGQ